MRSVVRLLHASMFVYYTHGIRAPKPERVSTTCPHRLLLFSFLTCFSRPVTSPSLSSTLLYSCCEHLNRNSIAKAAPASPRSCRQSAHGPPGCPESISLQIRFGAYGSRHMISLMHACSYAHTVESLWVLFLFA